MRKRKKEKPLPVPKCDACGVPFVHHLGLIGTCEALQHSRRTIRDMLDQMDRANRYTSFLEQKLWGKKTKGNK